MKKRTLDAGIRADDKVYNARKRNRAEKLETVERLDKIIKELVMPDAKREKLKDLRGNSHWYTSDQIKSKALYIINN